jgi:hypothetical protein
VTEGNSGTRTAVFTVSLSVASTQTVTVNFATANGTATTASGDYQAKSGTLTFSPGVKTGTISVVVNGDTSIERTETFFVNLSNAINAAIADNQGQGSIVNDDLTLRIGDEGLHLHGQPVGGRIVPRHGQLRHRQRHGDHRQRRLPGQEREIDLRRRLDDPDDHGAG